MNALMIILFSFEKVMKKNVWDFIRNQTYKTASLLKEVCGLGGAILFSKPPTFAKAASVAAQDGRGRAQVWVRGSLPAQPPSWERSMRELLLKREQSCQTWTSIAAWSSHTWRRGSTGCPPLYRALHRSCIWCTVASCTPQQQVCLDCVNRFLWLDPWRYKRTTARVLSFFSPQPCKSNEPGCGAIELCQQLLIDCPQPVCFQLSHKYSFSWDTNMFSVEPQMLSHKRVLPTYSCLPSRLWMRNKRRRAEINRRKHCDKSEIRKYVSSCKNDPNPTW